MARSGIMSGINQNDVFDILGIERPANIQIARVLISQSVASETRYIQTYAAYYLIVTRL